jgi:hypothetical protein
MTRHEKADKPDDPSYGDTSGDRTCCDYSRAMCARKNERAPLCSSAHMNSREIAARPHKDDIKGDDGLTPIGALQRGPQQFARAGLRKQYRLGWIVLNPKFSDY